MTINDTPEKLPFYKSKIMLGSIVAVICLVGTQFGLFAEIAPEGQAAIVEDILTVVGAIGGITAAVARVTQRFVPPITVTGAKS
jgi:hypothetical protein